MNLKECSRKVVNHDIILVRESNIPKQPEFRLQAGTRADRKKDVLRHEVGLQSPKKSEPYFLVWIRQRLFTHFLATSETPADVRFHHF